MLNALLHPRGACESRRRRHITADALAASRAPTMLSIYVYVACFLNLLLLIILLSWVLEARKGFFIVDVFLADQAAPTAGAVSVACSMALSALSHRGPDGRTGEASPLARRVTPLAVWLAGCWWRPWARTSAEQLALRTSNRRMDHDSTLRAGVRSAACPLPSRDGALLVAHRSPPVAWKDAVRLAARSAERLL